MLSYFQIVELNPTFDLYVSGLFTVLCSIFDCQSNSQELNLLSNFVILFSDYIFCNDKLSRNF